MTTTTTRPLATASEAEVLRQLEEVGALKTGHFLLSSGLHSERYCQCATLFEHPAVGERVARWMAAKLGSLQVDTVLAPALGGVLWGYDLARVLGVRSLFAERESGQPFTLRRGFALQPGERVLLAEDVVTTGKSVMELMPLVDAAGAKAVGFAAVVDRSGGKFLPPGSIPLFALAKLNFETYDPANCPLCRQGIPAVKPGSRAMKSGS